MTDYIEKPDVQYILHIKSDKKVEKRLIDYCLESVVDVFEDTGLTADVQPVKHGKWVDEACETVCSICGDCCIYGGDGETYLSNYCPNCGARMIKDGEQNEKED